MGCTARWVRAKRVGEGRVPDVEPTGAVKFRIVGETNGSPYQYLVAHCRSGVAFLRPRPGAAPVSLLALSSGRFAARLGFIAGV
ncbi:hypothetical protein GCM10008959_23740 [Deinococcus seoulensis]|uniref:Uncharacterized protein n=1 Tax=Deinococcus seoulensis TaxID=1837379 RepID=A0ABQ2RRT6_9DEIO|nr:hypothetical protein GCM10008959_23740 [Deinococcus seoulensis]